MSLDAYLNNRWIRTHETSAQEIASLLAIADRDIQQSQTPGLGPDWRFDIAYNSALQCATAGLAASGYQAERQNKHMRTIECLAFTVALDSRDVDLLDQCRRKRHTAVYEQVGAVSDHEADEMIHLARRLRRHIEDWLKKEHPRLLP
jgi:uncharacterized protein (UPF0332 family)